MLVVSLSLLMAQSALNNKADNIVGTYQAKQNHDNFKARITKSADGSYMAQIFWMENPCDKNGKPYLDEKNPDKSLRNVRCDKVVLMKGLKYDAAKKCWNDTKIYDPQRGIRANVTCTFGADGKLYLKGKILGISETACWTKIK